MKTVAHAIDNRLPQLFWLFLAGCILSAGLYLYFVNSTIRHIVSRSSNESSIEALKTDISSLETRAVALEQSVTIDEATRLGFQAADHVTFVDPRISARAFSLRDGI